MSGKKTKTMTLADLVLLILDENSGGIKMTKLVTEIVARACESRVFIRAKLKSISWAEKDGN